jgi:hypothetical protein
MLADNWDGAIYGLAGLGVLCWMAAFMEAAWEGYFPSDLGPFGFLFAGGVVLIIMAVVTWWISEEEHVQTLFRRCPSCGRRFGLKVTGKSLLGVGQDTYMSIRTSPGDSSAVVAQRPAYGQVRGPPPAFYDDYKAPVGRVRVTARRERLEYSYACSRCGHQWSEKRTTELRPEVEN